MIKFYEDYKASIKDLNPKEAINKLEKILFNLEMKDRWSMDDGARADALNRLIKEVKDGR